MFSVFKKLTKSGDGGSTPTPMSSALQKKFARGVDYNMKILIKGDRNVGKTCLLRRLQGGPFVEEYRPTDEIQAAAINWAYKNTHHIVKVDVWEVVDKGKSRKKSSIPLKIDNNSVAPSTDLETPTLDATFLDVYKDADGIVLMLDITKNWTYEYVMKELTKVPADIPVVVLGNHCDMQHHRQVQTHHIETMLEAAKATRKAVTEYSEASMRNGFGLRFLHRFFNIPFLALQRRSLLAQLQRNSRESTEAVVDLQEYQSSEECDYELYTQRLSERRVASNAVQSPPLPSGRSIVLGGGKPILPTDVNPLVSRMSATSLKKVETQTEQRSSNGKRGQTQFVDSELLNQRVAVVAQDSVSKNSDDLESFCAGTLDLSFLDDNSKSSANNAATDHTSNFQIGSDSDDDTVNPMVASILEDFETPETDDTQTKTKEYESPSQYLVKTHSNASQYNSKPIKNLSVDESNWKEEDKVWQMSENLDLGGRRSPEGGENPDTVEPDKTDKEKKHKSKKSKCKDKEKKKHKKREKERESKTSSLLVSDQPTEVPFNYDEYDSI